MLISNLLNVIITDEQVEISDSQSRCTEYMLLIFILLYVILQKVYMLLVFILLYNVGASIKSSAISLCNWGDSLHHFESIMTFFIIMRLVK